MKLMRLEVFFKYITIENNHFMRIPQVHEIEQSDLLKNITSHERSFQVHEIERTFNTVILLRMEISENVS